MPYPRVKRNRRRYEDPLARRTYRHPGILFAGTVGVTVLVIAAVRDLDGGMQVVYAIMAIVLVWLGWMCRMTIAREGVVVQNYGRSRVVPWRDITAVQMTKVRREDVLELELLGRRTVRVWCQLPPTPQDPLQGQWAVRACDGARRPRPAAVARVRCRSW